MDSDHLGLELSVLFQFKIVNFLADDLGYPGKWVKLVNFEADVDFNCLIGCSSLSTWLKQYADFLNAL